MSMHAFIQTHRSLVIFDTDTDRQTDRETDTVVFVDEFMKNLRDVQAHLQ